MHANTSTQTIRRFPLALTAFAVLLATVEPAVAAAQATKGDPRDTTHAQKQAPFFTAKDAVLAASFVGATLLMFPLDKQAAHALQDSSTQANRLLKHTTTDVEIITSPGAYIIGGALYAVGRLGKWDRVADLGWHGTEAVLFSQGVTTFLKGVVGRGRPFLSNGEDPGDYHPGKGFQSGDWSSFPSGHTSTAFAAAAAVTNETSRWWPRSVWIVGPLMYGGATAVGLSRMYHNRHWGSDVLLGAAIGTFSGRKMVQYAHGHPNNRLDRIMLSTRVVPDGKGGVAIGSSFQIP